MNKEAFDKLEIQQQVEYINGKLELNSLTKVCQNIGIDRSTVRKRFKSKGWELVDNRYINTGNTITTVNTKDTTNTKTQKKSNKSSDIKVLEDKINSLEAQIKGIVDTISTLNATTTVDTIDTTEIKKYEGDTVSRSYRVNEEIQKEFKILCRRLTADTDITVTDVINTALKEFIDKYK